MPRHYSSVLISTPDTDDDKPELRIQIECDVCGTIEIHTHIAHFGTLARTLSHYFRLLGGDDDGVTENMQIPDHIKGDERKAVEYMNRRFPEWKVGRLRERYGKNQG